MKVALPIAEVFRFFEDPANLARITPPSLGFEMTSGNLHMAPGLQIDYRIRWLGLPMRWTSLITAYDPPYKFVDEQLKGPYRYWQHRHEFTPLSDGTVIADRVSYSLPLGPLGRIAQALVVRHQLLGIFNYRQRNVPEYLKARCWQLETPNIRPVA